MTAGCLASTVARGTGAPLSPAVAADMAAVAEAVRACAGRVVRRLAVAVRYCEGHTKYLGDRIGIRDVTGHRIIVCRWLRNVFQELLVADKETNFEIGTLKRKLSAVDVMATKFGR